MLLLHSPALLAARPRRERGQGDGAVSLVGGTGCTCPGQATEQQQWDTNGGRELAKPYLWCQVISLVQVLFQSPMAQRRWGWGMGCERVSRAAAATNFPAPGVLWEGEEQEDP